MVFVSAKIYVDSFDVGMWVPSNASISIFSYIASAYLYMNWKKGKVLSYCRINGAIMGFNGKVSKFRFSPRLCSRLCSSFQNLFLFFLCSSYLIPDVKKSILFGEVTVKKVIVTIIIVTKLSFRWFVHSMTKSTNDPTKPKIIIPTNV